MIPHYNQQLMAQHPNSGRAIISGKPQNHVVVVVLQYLVYSSKCKHLVFSISIVFRVTDTVLIVIIFFT